MRPLVLALAALAASGCVVYETRPFRPPPPTAPSAQPGPPEPGARLLSEEEAVKVAFDAARERGLEVDRVQKARLDATGRWHVDVRGRGDRALLLIDARSGRLLKGKFRERGGEPGGGGPG
jgi:hypothetical protein